MDLSQYIDIQIPEGRVNKIDDRDGTTLWRHPYTLSILVEPEGYGTISANYTYDLDTASRTNVDLCSLYNVKYGMNVYVSTTPRSDTTFTQWSDGQTSKNHSLLNIKRNSVLVAYYNKIAITLTLDANGGILDLINGKQTYSVVHSSTIPFIWNPSRVGYSFSGWYCDSDCTSKLNLTGTSTFTSNLTAYAGWIKQQEESTQLIAHYTYYDSSSNDKTTNHNDPSAQSGTTYEQIEDSGNATTIKGIRFQSGGISVPNSSTLSSMTQQNFTMMCWAYLFSTSRNENLILQKQCNGSLQRNNVLEFCINHYYNEVIVEDNSKNSIYVKTSSSNIPVLGEWHHVAVVRKIATSGTQVVLEYYYDGVLCESKTCNIVANIDSAGNPLEIGYSLDGYLVDLRLYNNALDASTIEEIKNSILHTVELTCTTEQHGALYGSGTYGTNSIATLKVAPDVGYKFAWDDETPRESAIDETTWHIYEDQRQFEVSTDVYRSVRFKIRSYSVTFNYYDGITKKSTQYIVNYGSTSQVPSNYQRTGYTFIGWDKSYSNITENTTITARYSTIIYTISYNLAGGQNNSENPTTYTVESDTITLKNPSRQYYEFTYWTVDGKSRNTIPNGSTGNIAFTANWNQVQFWLTYHSNMPGDSTTYTQLLNAGTSYSVKSTTTFTRSGWKSNAWNTMADGSGVSYTNGSTITPTQNTDLYAIWDRSIVIKRGIHNPSVTVAYTDRSGSKTETLQSFPCYIYPQGGTSITITANGGSNHTIIAVDGSVKKADDGQQSYTISDCSNTSTIFVCAVAHVGKYDNSSQHEHTYGCWKDIQVNTLVGGLIYYMNVRCAGSHCGHNHCTLNEKVFYTIRGNEHNICNYTFKSKKDHKHKQIDFAANKYSSSISTVQHTINLTGQSVETTIPLYVAFSDGASSCSGMYAYIYTAITGTTP